MSNHLEVIHIPLPQAVQSGINIVQCCFSDYQKLILSILFLSLGGSRGHLEKNFNVCIISINFCTLRAVVPTVTQSSYCIIFKEVIVATPAWHFVGKLIFLQSWAMYRASLFQVAFQVRGQKKASFVSVFTPANNISFTITILVHRALSVLVFKQLFLCHGLSQPLSRCQFPAPKPGAKRKHDNLSIAPQIPEVILQPEKLTYF